FRYHIDGRQRQMGLGGTGTLNLSEARERAREYRKLVKDDIDPIDRRRIERTVNAKNRKLTVRTALLEFVETHRAGWCVEYTRQVLALFERYVLPKIGNLPIQAANDTRAILGVIELLWPTRNQTAWRIRGLLENLIDWAKFHRYCTGENAARWKGHLSFHLPAPSKVRAVRHHPALPYPDVPEFLQKLRQRRAIAAIALEFTILTAGRQKESRFARWREFDLDRKIWSIPAERMKA